MTLEMILEREVDSLFDRGEEGLGSKQWNLDEKQKLPGPFRDPGLCSGGTSQTLEDLRSLIKNLDFMLKATRNHLTFSSKEINLYKSL